MSSYLTPLFVALGGALGALTRYTVTLLAASFLGSSFPYGTLLVNGAGSFLIGLLAFFFTQHFPSPLASAFLVTGFLGGLTTFSSMMNEIMQFFLAGHLLEGCTYLRMHLPALPAPHRTSCRLRRIPSHEPDQPVATHSQKAM